MPSFSYVNSTFASNSNTATLTGVTAGHLLLIVAAAWPSTTLSTTASDGTNTWEPMMLQLNLSNIQMIVLGTIARASGSVTVNYSLTGTGTGWALMEYAVPADFALTTVSTFYTFTSSAVTAKYVGIVQNGTESLLVSFGFDQHSGHAWTATNATIRESHITADGGESFVAGDTDFSTGFSLTSPYTATYSGGSSSTAMIGGVLCLIDTSGGTPSGTSYAFIS